MESPSIRYITSIYETAPATVRGFQIQEVKSPTEILSPPHFLDDDDSKGLYTASKGKALDPADRAKYGEAVVEFRMLRIHSEDLDETAARTEDAENSYILREGSEKLLAETRVLFEFLRGLSREKFLSRRFINEIIKYATK